MTRTLHVHHRIEDTSLCTVETIDERGQVVCTIVIDAEANAVRIWKGEPKDEDLLRVVKLP